MANTTLPLSNNQQYFLLFGSFPELSWAEVQAVAEIKNPQKAGKFGAIAQLTIPASEVIDKLGGVVKIGLVLATLDSNLPTDIEEWLQSWLTQQGSITFGVGEIGRDHHPKLNLGKIKATLPEAQKYRYLSSERNGLSAAVLLHKTKVQEILFIQTENGILVVQTVGVQDIDLWTVKDRHKPYASRQRGMLPPKVARIMVNLALNGQVGTPDLVLLDPFVGSGTVLIEALASNLSVIGSDLDAEAVTGTNENLIWYKQNFSSAGSLSVMQADATHLTSNNLPTPVNFIATEPFLGKPKPSPEFVQNMFKGLEKLYLGAAKNWTKFLADGANIVIVTPHVTVGKHTYTMQRLIDKLHLFGYTTTLGPLEYQRPQAIVKRHIWRLQYNRQ